jgi:hypothetical protein
LRAGEARAVQICYGCDVQAECLLWAMGQRHSDQNGLAGIWGGLTAAQRESHQILNRAGLPAGRFLR